MIPSMPRRASLLAGLCACALLAPGCHEPAPEPAVAESEGAFVPFVATGDAEGSRWTYEGVLGVVTALPVEGDPASELRLHHEHIPAFRAPRTGEININSDGVPGMRAMIMDMPPAEGMDVAPLAVGDKVRFTFAVWDEPRISWRVTRIERLDPSTEISFDDKP